MPALRIIRPPCSSPRAESARPVPHPAITGAVTLCLLVFVNACTPGATRQAALSRPDQRAQQLGAEGDFHGAAGEYLRLAGLYPDQARGYRLTAAGLLLDAGNADAARALLDEPAVGKPAPDEKLHRDILRARFELRDGRPAEALSLLAQDAGKAVPALRAQAHAVRAEALEMSGDLLAAARERIVLSGFPRGEAAERENLLRLWANLNAVGGERLAAAVAAADGEFAGWAELALLNIESASSPETLRLKLAAWVEANPAHPAVPLITEAMLAQSRRFESAPQRIALLVPLSGQYANAGAAIRDGALAAWYQNPAFRPQIRIYDANSLNVVEQYRQAVADGAQFIIGPLEKAAIAKLVESAIISTPTLALNRLDDSAGDERMRGLDSLLPNLIQFGLTPEDEARQAAQRAIFDGHARALVMTPANDWGRRLARAFQEEWQLLGGAVVEQVLYEPVINDFSTTAAELFNIDSSESRARLLRERLGRRVEYGARLREDADMVFLAAVPVAARQILPQFRFFAADHIAVYSSSHAYTGNLDPQLDSDMNGLMFPDMPWILEPGDETEQSVDRNWAARSSNFRRLYAFGADALGIVPELGRLSTQPGAIFSGATGMLLMDRDAVIQRRLSWARIVNGAPRAIDRSAGG